MMKTIKLILCLALLIPATSSAGMFDRVISQYNAAGGAPACDSCTGGLEMAWHMENVDVTLGTPCGCSTLGDTV